MRSLPFGLAAAALTALALAAAPGASFAQDTRGVQPAKAKPQEQQTGDPEKDKAKGMAEAPPLLQQAGAACTVSDALWKGTTNTEVEGGKKSKTKVYEVACSDAPGYIVMAPEGAAPSAYNCLAMNQAAAEGKSGVSCTLAANAEPFKGLQPIVTKGGMRCTVTKGRWAGANTEKKYDQFEVACAEGGAYIIQAPMGGSTHPFAQVNCIQVASTGACQYLTKEQAVAQIAAIAAPANRTSCQPTDVRFVGEAPGKAVYYEVGCADGKSGYVLQTDPAGKFVSAVECARASTIAGGCQLTQVKIEAGEETGLYTKLVSGIGYQCAVSNYRSLGLDPQGREIVEIMCNGKSSPSVAFIPSGGTQKGEVWDCARAEAHSLKCALAQGVAAYAFATEKITAAGKECKVNKVRAVGSTAEGGDYVEVGCEGGGALMVEYGPGNLNVKSVLNCGQAKSIGGGCKFITIG